MSESEKPTSPAARLSQLSEAEEKVVRDPLFASATPEIWKEFSSKATESILASYEDGEILLLDALKSVWTCAIGCEPNERLKVMAFVAIAVRKIKAHDLNAKKPDVPSWIRNSAVQLALMLKEENSSTKIGHDSGDNVNVQAIDQLMLMGIIGGDTGYSFEPKTLYEWVREYRNTNGLEVRKTGPKANTTGNTGIT